MKVSFFVLVYRSSVQFSIDPQMTSLQLHLVEAKDFRQRRFQRSVLGHCSPIPGSRGAWMPSIYLALNRLDYNDPLSSHLDPRI